MALLPLEEYDPPRLGRYTFRSAPAYKPTIP